MKELIHNTDCGKIEVFNCENDGECLGGVEICFRGYGCEMIDIAQVLYNPERKCLEVLVYGDPFEADYTDSFEVKIRDIEDAMSVPF